MKRLIWKLYDFLRMLALLGLVALGSAWLASLSEVGLAGKPRFVDGDSLFLQGQEIRLLGIDAPEIRQECRSADGAQAIACGRQALAFVRGFSESGELVCTGWEYDKYDRLLAICKQDDVELNRELVMNGWAVSFGAYEAEEAVARREQRGMWAGSFQPPSQWRNENRQAHSVNWLNRLKFW